MHDGRASERARVSALTERDEAKRLAAHKTGRKSECMFPMICVTVYESRTNGSEHTPQAHNPHLVCTSRLKLFVESKRDVARAEHLAGGTILFYKCILIRPKA